MDLLETRNQKPETLSSDWSASLKIPVCLSVALHAMILLLFGAGMGFQSGGPGKVEVMYVSLVREPGPRSKIQDPRSVIQNSESGSKEVALNSQPSTFDVQTFDKLTVLSPAQGRVEGLSTLSEIEMKSNVQFPISNFDSPISNFESRISNPKPVAVTAYAGELIPTGMLGSGEKADAGFIHYPPVTSSLPRPPYPLTSRRKGEEGTVTLSFLVYSDGTVGEISVVESSGYPRLDKAASRSLRSALFRPVSESGLLVTSNRKIAFSFRLED